MKVRAFVFHCGELPARRALRGSLGNHSFAPAKRSMAKDQHT